jgi:hypothetical protein
VKSGSASGTVLPWGAHKERSPYPACVHIDMDIRPGEFVMRTLFADFTVQAEKKMEAVMAEPLVLKVHYVCLEIIMMLKKIVVVIMITRTLS